MPSSIESNIGVSVKLQLNFKNIDVILKLLSSHAKLIIYGLSKSIDRDCKFYDDENKPSYFDNRILHKLSEFKNQEEFMEYASKVAEMRGDKMVLRKKIEYVNFEDEGEVDDYLELLDNYDSLNDKYDSDDNSENDSENDSKDETQNETQDETQDETQYETQDETQENINSISDQESDVKKLESAINNDSNVDNVRYIHADMEEEHIKSINEYKKQLCECLSDIKTFLQDIENETIHDEVDVKDDKNKLKKRYEQSKDEQKYVDCNLNEKKISFLFYINLLNFDLSLNLRSEYDTDYGTVGKLSEFMNDIDKATKFFTDLGIDEESISVFNYNSSEGY